MRLRSKHIVSSVNTWTNFSSLSVFEAHFCSSALSLTVTPVWFTAQLIETSEGFSVESCRVFKETRHQTLPGGSVCTCSPYRHLLLVLHQEVLHHLSSLQTDEWQKKTLNTFYWSLRIKLWISPCSVPFGRPVQVWASPALSAPVMYSAEWRPRHHPRPEPPSCRCVSVWEKCCLKSVSMKLTETLRFCFLFCTVTLTFIGWLCKSSGRRWRHDRVLAIIAKRTDLQRVNAKNHQVQPIKATRSQREGAAINELLASMLPQASDCISLRRGGSDATFTLSLLCYEKISRQRQCPVSFRRSAWSTRNFKKKSLGREIQQPKPVQDGYGWSELAAGTLHRSKSWLCCYA